jgi:RNA polymerase sigma factor (sigma-70 family)
MAAVHRALAPAVLDHLQGGFGYQARGERRFMRVSSAFDAEEICQEAFLKLFEQLRKGGFDVERPVAPYLLRIASNLALRRAGRGGREVVLESPPEVPARVDTPEQAEAARLLAEFRAGLPVEDDAVVRTWFDGDISQAEAGSALGLSRDQVYRAICRVRAAALRFFGQKGWFDDPR